VGLIGFVWQRDEGNMGFLAEKWGSWLRLEMGVWGKKKKT
jgi:hypothetical protein